MIDELHNRLAHNLRTLVKYSEWQVTEGGTYHPTLPSAILGAKAALLHYEADKNPEDDP